MKIKFVAHFVADCSITLGDPLLSSKTKMVSKIGQLREYYISCFFYIIFIILYIMQSGENIGTLVYVKEV